jgi:hypothetical protein
VRKRAEESDLPRKNSSPGRGYGLDHLNGWMLGRLSRVAAPCSIYDSSGAGHSTDGKFPSQNHSLPNHFNPLAFLSSVPPEKRFIYNKKESIL